MLYGVKVVEPRPVVRLMGNIGGASLHRPYCQPFPWGLLAAEIIILALLVLIITDAATGFMGLPRQVRMFLGTGLGSSFGMLLIPLLFEIIDNVRAKLR